MAVEILDIALRAMPANAGKVGGFIILASTEGAPALRIGATMENRHAHVHPRGRARLETRRHDLFRSVRVPTSGNALFA